jgi:nicotinamidase-related amidase
MSRDICNYDMGALGPRLWRNSPDGFNMPIANGAGLDDMKAVKRIVPNRCCGVIVDLQGFFLSQVDKRLGSRIKTNTGNLVRLLNHFRIPIVVTLERPVDFKESLPKEIGKHLGDRAQIFEKNFFDLCKDKKIKGHLARLKRRQVIVAGCETDVCVLQSCLGLLSLGYEVTVMEELIFSSSRNVDAAIARMKAEGVIFSTYKTLYYELIEAVEGGRHTEKALKAFGPLPDDLPDSAVQ